MKQSGPVKWIRRILPYAGTGAILVVLYYRLKTEFDPEEFFNAIRDANLPLLIAGTALPFCIYFIVNVTYASRVFTWFVAPLPVSEIAAVRGASLLLNLINPAVSGGAWLIYLIRKTGASFVRAVSMGMLNLAAVLTWAHTIVTAVLILMWTGNYPPVSGKILYGLTIYTVFGWLWFFHTVSFWLAGWKWGPVNAIREWEIMEVFRRATVRHWLIVGILTLPMVFSAVIGQYLCALAFGIEMPFHVFIGKFLIVIMYLLIPAVGGVGPLTWGWLNAFKGLAPPETIIACTLAEISIAHLTRVLLGLICLLPATREIARLNKREANQVDSGRQTV